MQDPRVISQALDRLRKLKMQEAFDPYSLDSRPNDIQSSYLQDINTFKVRLIRAGGQCLAKGTLVATPKGPIAIELLVAGDKVYDKDGKEITVLDTHSNGPKEVVELTHRGQVFVEATDEHVFLVNTAPGKNPYKECKVKDFSDRMCIKRTFVQSSLGITKEPTAYLLGAFLGDGVCTSKGKLTISTKDEEIVKKCAKILNCSYKKQSNYNFSWTIDTTEAGELYNRWCFGKLAHEKFVDINILRTWDRESLLEFLAGVVDTDGCIYINKFNTVELRIGMQAKSVVEACQYAILALWQAPTSIIIDADDKYKNGPIYRIQLANSAITSFVLKELGPYIQVSRKQWKSEYSECVHQNSSRNFIGVKKGKRRVVETYDITVSSPDNLYLLANGLVTHNSGKSATIARELAWILTDTHPTWSRPDEWGAEPYLVLIAGADRKMMETELWGNKLKPFLLAQDGEDAWREVRSGNALQHVEHRRKGYKIVFLSHADSSESNRKHMQGYVAHFVWMDELSNNISIIEELQRRVLAKNGWFSISFTPKGKAESIRKWADSMGAPYGKIYRMGQLDNPIYATRKEELIERIKHMPEGMRNTVLYGDWEVGDQTVYQFDWHMVAKPDNYSKGWRHVEANDPAMSGKMGFILFAEDPTSGVWYAIKEEYIEGYYSPDDLVHYVQSLTSSYNIVRRVSDYAPWYVGMASKNGMTYIHPYKKNERKDELIKGLQLALSQGKIKIAPWCEHFISELQTAQWSTGEAREKIVNRKNLHLQDAAQYFVDCMPKPEVEFESKTWWQLLREGNDKRKKTEKLRVKNRNKYTMSQGKWRRV